MPRASTPTLIPLDYFAQSLGILGMHFAGATAPDAPNNIFAVHNTCANVWPQYTWQTPEQASREELALALRDAERKIQNELKYALAPHWKIFHPAQPDASGKTFLGEGKLISPGQRATTLLATVVSGTDMLFTDLDGDTYAESVVLTVPVTAGQDRRELHVYFSGHSAHPAWEIFPRDIVISGTTATITLWNWQVLLPSLWEAFPQDANYRAINLSIPADVCVTGLEVYRVYPDPELPSVVFYWSGDPNCASCGGSGCAVCTEVSQNGCFKILDREMGWVQPYPAEYSNGQWLEVPFTYAKRPDYVYFYFYAGDRSQEYLSNQTLLPFDLSLARNAIMLAVCDLARPFCACSNVNSLVADWRRDAAFDEASNLPFTMFTEYKWGSMRGQQKAWEAIHHLFPPVHAFGVTIP